MAHVVTLREAFDDLVADKPYQRVSPATASFTLTVDDLREDNLTDVGRARLFAGRSSDHDHQTGTPRERVDLGLHEGCAGHGCGVVQA
jgi:hypothetical protein